MKYKIDNETGKPVAWLTNVLRIKCYTGIPHNERFDYLKGIVYDHDKIEDGEQITTGEIINEKVINNFHVFETVNTIYYVNHYDYKIFKA